MKNRIASLSVLLLAGLLLTTAQMARAQQTSGGDARGESINPNNLVTVTGAVYNPSRFELRRRVRLREILALVGGVSSHASGTIQISHPSHVTSEENGLRRLSDAVETYKLLDVLSDDDRANPFLEPGDIVTAVMAEHVYVIGSVVAPQVLSFREGITLRRAVAMVGGPSPDAKTDRIIIFRRADNDLGISPIYVNLKAIIKGRAPDVALKPYDIVQVLSKHGDYYTPVIGRVGSQLPVRVIQ